MSFAKIFLLLTLLLILLLLSFQTVFIRIAFSPKAMVAIEYFPFKLILYNFLKKNREKKKRKLMKSAKKAVFFFVPSLKALSFLMQKSTVQVLNFNTPDSKSEEPHRIFVTQEFSNLLNCYAYAVLFSAFKDIANEPGYQNETTADFDIQISTRFYNVVFSGIVFIFLAIKKKGRIKKFV